MLKRTHIIVHHSLTKDGLTTDWQAIRNYHTSWKLDGQAYTKAEADQLILAGKKPEPPWRDIGYHFGVEKINNHYEALVGRPFDMEGSHTTQEHMNEVSIGVMLVGNFDKEVPDPGMLLFTVKYVVAPLARTFNIPIENIQPHCKYATYKSCPGTLFPWASFLLMVKEAIDASKPIGTIT